MAKRNRTMKKRKFRGGVAALKRNSGVRNIGLNVAPIEIRPVSTKIEMGEQLGPLPKKARIQAPAMISMAPNPFNIAHREIAHQESVNMPGELKHYNESAIRKAPRHTVKARKNRKSLR